MAPAEQRGANSGKPHASSKGVMDTQACATGLERFTLRNHWSTRSRHQEGNVIRADTRQEKKSLEIKIKVYLYVVGKRGPVKGYKIDGAVSARDNSNDLSNFKKD